MKNVRIIPRLDIKGANLIKGIHFEGLRVLGKPEDFAKHYYENGADELIYQDIVASLYGRNSLHEVITKTAKNIFIPLTVGGGVRSLDDIRDLLKAGADKVSINTAAIKNPEIIKQAAQKFGSSTIVVAIEAIKEKDGKYFVYIENGREATGVEVVSWASRVATLGAGEIIISSIDNEGTGIGFNINLIKLLLKNVNIPVIAHGGCGKLEHIKNVILDTNVDGVAIASVLHYDFINKKRDVKKEGEGNISFLKSRNSFSKVDPCGLREIKDYLKNQNINCRWV